MAGCSYALVCSGLCILGGRLVGQDLLLLGYFDGELVWSEGDSVGVELPLRITDAFRLYRQTGYDSRHVHVRVAREQNAMLLALDLGVVGDIHNDDFARFLVADANQIPVAGKNRPCYLCFVACCDLTSFVCGCVRDAGKQNGGTRTKQHIQFPLTNIKFHCNSSKLVFSRLAAYVYAMSSLRWLAAQIPSSKS